MTMSSDASRAERAQRWVVDAIEENVASIEVSDGGMITLPVAALPSGIKQGQVLRVIITIDDAATKQALADSAAQVKKGRDASRKRDPGGDIKL
jgi:L-cysteine desulfidase